VPHCLKWWGSSDIGTEFGRYAVFALEVAAYLVGSQHLFLVILQIFSYSLSVERGAILPRGMCPGEAVLAAYIDGELSDPLLSELTTHLSSCSECRRLISEIIVSKRNVQPGNTNNHSEDQ
jgi:hypothetical protein